jgi:H+/Na+-translocating ferredoxin:NAD+ oxidoreductase subunit B
MFAGTAILVGLGLAFALLAIAASRWLPRREDSGPGLVEQIEALLPRIQCAQCGYPGCRPYAEAIAAGIADINLCPPGGDTTVRRLAELLGRASPLVPTRSGASLGQIAVIEEALCIGCNLCARVCPVDAIAGVPQMMHTVITQHCTGCELCLAPCPVDCIRLAPRHA